MKLIFLDVDGVLNRVQTKAQAPSGCTGIETELVKNLAKIVSETKALIILTSDWKVGWEAVSVCCSEDAKYLNEMLAKEGLQIVGKTYDDHVVDPFLQDRGRGIHQYLDALGNAEGYVVLDDHIFGDFDEEIRRHLIKTNCFEGLSVEKAKQAIVIINNGADTDR